MYSLALHRVKSSNPWIGTLSESVYRIVWMKKPRHRKAKLLTPGATARKLQGWDLNPGSLTPEPVHFITPSLRIQAVSVPFKGEAQVSSDGKREGSTFGERAEGSLSPTGAERPAFQACFQHKDAC